MKNYLKTLGLGVVFIALAGFVFLFFGAPYQSQACGGGGQEDAAGEVHREVRVMSLSKEGPGDGGPVHLPAMVGERL